MKGKKVLISRPKEEAKDFRESLEKVGAEVAQLPMIQFDPIEDLKELHAIFDELERIDWIVFTSATTVRFFFEAAEKYGVKFYFYPELKIATVGEKTKLKLEQLGYRTNFVPIKYTAEVLAENMDEVKGKRILIPRSNIASNEYIKVFEKRGATAIPTTVYNTKRTEYSSEEIINCLQKGLDYLTFTSSSTFKAFNFYLKQTAFQLSKEQIICIGPSTAKTVEELGYTVSGIADSHTSNGIVQLIKKLEENV